MKLIDITRVVQQAPIYPGSSPVTLQPLLRMGNGDAYNASQYTSGTHMGTHADAFWHFLDDGAAIDEMPLLHYYGPCRVVTVPADALLEPALFAGLPGCERLVLHTGGNSYLSQQAADALRDTGLLTLVTDAMSVAPPDNEPGVHKALMRAGVAIVENVCLDGVADGAYILCAAPVKLGGADGAPVRAFLIKP